MTLHESSKWILECAKSIGCEELYGLCSGGKDSMTACWIAHRITPLKAIITIDTTIGLPCSIEAAKKLADLLQIPHIVLIAPSLKDGDERSAYEQYVAKYGFPHQPNHQMVFIYLKWKPLSRFAKAQSKRIGFVSGTRSAESRRRFGNCQPLKIDPSHKAMVWVAPIIDYSTAECWDIVRSNNLPLSDSYQTIHLSGDCLCGAFADSGEAEMLKVFYPDIAERIALLERKYKDQVIKNGGWGNGSQMNNVLCQKGIDQYVCADCQIGHKNGENHD